MAKIKINELEVNKSQLKDLSDIETITVIGGYDDEETKSSRDMIQRAMQAAVNRSDMSQNGSRAFSKSSN